MKLALPLLFGVYCGHFQNSNFLESIAFAKCYLMSTEMVLEQLRNFLIVAVFALLISKLARIGDHSSFTVP